jgi:hypothetical protein
MNIISGNLTQPNSSVVIDGNRIQTPQGASEQPVELKAGSTIQGTVVSVSDAEGGRIANINVGDSVISAKLQEGMGLREGQTLNFSVRSSGPGGVSITPLYENTSVDQSTLKALTAAGIPVNNDTVNMVKSMMEASLSIGKEVLTEMNRNLNMHPNTSISTMVEMKSLNIPITDNNITQFQNYKNYEHQVTTTMESIMEELPSAFSEMISAGNETGALNLFGSVLKLFGQEGAPAAGGEEASLEAANPEAVNQEAAAKTGIGGNPQEGGIVTDTEGRTVITLSEDGEVLLTEGGSDAAVKGAGQEAEKTAGKATDKADLLTAGDKSQVLSGKFTDNLRNLGISEETINKYNQALKEADGNAQGQSQGASAWLELAQKELLKELSDAFDHSNLSNPAEKAIWKNIFSNKDYTRLLKDNMSSQWLLKPLDVEKKENIDNLYQRLGNQAKGLSNAINNSLGAESRLGQAATNLQNNLDFMNQLNQMFQYVQLPLQMAGQNVHGDLYVYRNKHKKMSDDGSVSAALHLDMENLGPVDVYVKMKDTKVSTNFYVADESVIDLINDNIHILNERLEKRGYSMNVTMKLHDDMDGQDAAVDEMLSVSKTTILSTASFDARA